ncbi:MAG: hypothetical protein H6672_01110 [Anaerolineaceae bacterium]|nr:hypothetical protein [Anaerolineaceae bacterium]
MRQLTTERAAVIILFALLFALAARIPTDTDTWWHIRSGEYTLTHGMIYADPFSFTKAGEPWINHSWGAQIILYGVWQIAGNVGLAVYTAGLATAGMWFIYQMCAGNAYLRAFVLVLGAATAAVFWSPRPQMLSFVLSAVVLYILHLHKRRGIDRLWWIPVIMGVWGNLHAGFSIGFIFLGGSIAGEILGNIFTPKVEAVVPWRGIRKLMLVTLVSVAALLVNPYGLQILTVPFQTVGIGALQNFIQEWNSPDFHQQQTWPFIALLLGTLGAVGASSKRLDWRDFVLVAGTAFMGLLAGRNIAVFAVAATPVLTLHLAAALDERGWILTPARRATPRMARLNALLIGLVALGALAKVLIVLDAKTVQTAQEEFLPVLAVDYLNETAPPGPMFNSYNWGGYLLFARPDEPAFVDGRTDLYGDTFLTNDYLNTATGRDGWRETLDSYGIRLVMVEADSGLARALRDEPGWSLDYEDEQAVVFTREAVE